MPTIIFSEFDGTQHGVDVENGVSMMEAARIGDVPGIDAECGGAGACATCHVYIGEHWRALLPPIGRVERELLELVDEHSDESRLSCQIIAEEALDGIVVRLPGRQGF